MRLAAVIVGLCAAMTPGARAHAQLFDALAIAVCAKIPEQDARLKCFDTAAKKLTEKAAPEWTLVEDKDPITDRVLTLVVREVRDDGDRSFGLALRCFGPNYDVVIATGRYIPNKLERITVTQRVDSDETEAVLWYVGKTAFGHPTADADKLLRRLLGAQRVAFRFTLNDEQVTAVVELKGFADKTAKLRERCPGIPKEK